jgi:hypothetical protein
VDNQTIENLVDKACSIANDAALAQIGGQPYFYGSQSLFRQRQNSLPNGPMSEYFGHSNIRYHKLSNSPDVSCVLHFTTSANKDKLILRLRDVSAGFEDALKKSLEQFLQENSDLVKLASVETNSQSVKKDEQNQGSEVSRDEKVKELRSLRSRDILYICYWAGASIVTLIFFVVACASSTAPLIVKIATGLGLIVEIFCFCLSCGRLRKRNKAIAELKTSQETTDNNVQP